MNPLLTIKQYDSPSVRVVEVHYYISFLLSNTEIIIDDGQEHGWD